MVADARTRLEQAQAKQGDEAGAVEDAAKLLADMVAIGGTIGFGVKN